MKKISFSIITPTYNRLESGYLETCIKSIQSQVGNNFDFEHIIVNDASSDDTRRWLKEATNKYKNLRIINHRSNQNTAASYMDGLLIARNDYIIFIDDDDMLPSNSLETRSNFALENPGVDWFYGKARWIDEIGRPLKVTYQSTLPEDMLYERALIKNYIHNGTPSIKKSALEGFSWPDWLTKRQDYFLWLELLRPSNNLRVGFIDEFIFTYRVHQGAFTTSWQDSKEISKEMDSLGYRMKKEFHSEGLANLAMIANDQYYEIRKLKKKIEELETT